MSDYKPKNSFTGNIYTDDGEETVEVDFDYDSGQKLIMYPNDSAQEGIPASVELTSVTLYGTDILSNLTQAQYNDLIEQCWEQQKLEDEKFDRHW